MHPTGVLQVPSAWSTWPVETTPQMNHARHTQEANGMSEKIIGIDICAPDAPTALAHIRKAEEMGIQGVWLTGSGGGTGNDSLMVLSAGPQPRPKGFDWAPPSY